MRLPSKRACKLLAELRIEPTVGFPKSNLYQLGLRLGDALLVLETDSQLIRDLPVLAMAEPVSSKVPHVRICEGPKAGSFWVESFGARFCIEWEVINKAYFAGLKDQGFIAGSWTTNDPILGGAVGLVLENQLIAACTHLTNTICLHAASAIIGDTLLIVLGGSGSGKTTLSLALLAAGHQVISDDLVLVNFTRQTITAFPKPLVPSLGGNEDVNSDVFLTDLCYEHNRWLRQGIEREFPANVFFALLSFDNDGLEFFTVIHRCLFRGLLSENGALEDIISLVSRFPIFRLQRTAVRSMVRELETLCL